MSKYDKDMTIEVIKIIKNEKTKVADRVYNNVIDRDQFPYIILDTEKKIFWLESWGKDIPNYAYDYIVSLVKRKFKARYLHDLYKY